MLQLLFVSLKLFGLLGKALVTHLHVGCLYDVLATLAFHYFHDFYNSIDDYTRRSPFLMTLLMRSSTHFL
jgi:hypothetical protein